MTAGIGVAAGLTLGVGLTLVAAWQRARRPRLAARLEPYVRPATAEPTHAGGVAQFWTVLVPRPTMAVLAWMSPANQVRTRIRRAGSPLTLEQYRAQQMVCGLVGLLAGTLVSLALMRSRGVGLVPSIVIVVSCTMLAVLGRDAALTARLRQRERRMLAQLPPIAEMLALSVTAGEGALGALERVAATTSGDLADEMRAALSAARAGQRLPDALAQMAEASAIPALRRFADGIVIAVEHGTPLAQVLRAQAADARAQSRMELMEEGGRREIAMMIPVVFLILPVTVLFGVYPALVAIQFTAP